MEPLSSCYIPAVKCSKDLYMLLIFDIIYPNVVNIGSFVLFYFISIYFISFCLI